MVFALVWAGLAQAGGLTAQTFEDPFLRSANLNATYPDYVSERYTRYAAGFASRRAIFDRLGQFVNHGTYSLRWNELRDEFTNEKIAAGVPLNQLDARSSVLYQRGDHQPRDRAPGLRRSAHEPGRRPAASAPPSRPWCSTRSSTEACGSITGRRTRT